MFAKIKNNTVIEYPVDPKADNPNVSFPDNWQGGIVNNIEYAQVYSSSPPSANLGWTVSESNTFIKTAGRWYKEWQTTLLPTNQLQSAIANKRYELETMGIVVNNYVFSTDRDSQTKYTGVSVNISNMSNTDSFSINWKVIEYSGLSDIKPTFITMNATDFKYVANAVYDYVQSCFNKESEYLTLIQTANTTVLESTDFSAGWPSNVKG